MDEASAQSAEAQKYGRSARPAAHNSVAMSQSFQGGPPPARLVPATVPPGTPLRESTTMIGIALMVGAGLVFTLMDATAKYLSQRYPVVEIAFGRYLFATLTLPLIVQRAGSFGTIRSRRLGLQLLRSMFLVGATLLFWAAIKSIPLADATAISFIGPLMVTALSMPILKEQVDRRRWTAVLIGFVGALFIIRPGLGMAEPAALLPLASATCFALYAICTRILNRWDGWATTLVWSASAGLVLLSALAPFNWRMPDARGWAEFAFLGFISSVGHMLLILAYARANASILAPLSYIQLIWSTVMGLVLFGNFPDAWTLAGGTVIAASGLYVIDRSRQRRAEAD
jgi:drug/metabolite transporter (DMT)-like permease